MTRSEFFKALGLTALSLGVFKLVGDRKILKERNEKTYLDIPEELRQNPYGQSDATVSIEEDDWVKSSMYENGQWYWKYTSKHKIIKTSWGQLVNAVKFVKQ